MRKTPQTYRNFALIAGAIWLFGAPGEAQSSLDLHAGAWVYGASTGAELGQGGREQAGMVGGEASFSLLGQRRWFAAQSELTVFRLGGRIGESQDPQGEFGLTPFARVMLGARLLPDARCAPTLVVGGEAGQATTTVDGVDYLARDDSSLRAGLGLACQTPRARAWLDVESGYGALGWGAGASQTAVPIAGKLMLVSGPVFASGHLVWFVDEHGRAAQSQALRMGLIAAPIGQSHGFAIGAELTRSVYPHEALGEATLTRAGLFAGVMLLR